MEKKKAIELIQTVRKALSQTQIEAMIQAEIAKGGGTVTEEAAVHLVLAGLGIAVPEPPAAPESFEERRRRMEAEPDAAGGLYLKPSTVLPGLGRKPEVGDMVLIKEVSLEPEKTLENGNVIPSRPLLKGAFIPKGRGTSPGEEVLVTLSRGNEKNLYKMWGASLDRCVGMRIMVASIQNRVIGGTPQSWFEWAGLN